MRSPRLHGRRATAVLVALLTVPAALGALPAAASAAVSPLAATLEGGFGEFSQTNVETGTLALTTGRAYDGRTSAFATYSGGGANGYSRGIWNVDWHDGEDVWFGAAYYLPKGFIANVQGQVDLVRWDNWVSHPNDTDWGGVSVYGSDHRARLLRFGAGRPNNTLVGPFDLPEGRWFTLEVHQRLSAGAGALNELYLDGHLIGRSTRPNTYGRAIQRIRYGIVAIAEDAQRRPLDLWFDRATAGPQPASPLTAQASTVARPRFARRQTISPGPSIGVSAARPAG
ncbi:MAG: hypothetical protein ACM3N0_03010 [Chloroflexota bacterium]